MLPDDLIGHKSPATHHFALLKVVTELCAQLEKIAVRYIDNQEMRLHLQLRIWELSEIFQDAVKKASRGVVKATDE